MMAASSRDWNVFKQIFALTFRTLFWSSEAILTAPLEESGGRAISSAYQPTELLVFLGSSS
jgi:hypothetical protein